MSRTQRNESTKEVCMQTSVPCATTTISRPWDRHSLPRLLLKVIGRYSKLFNTQSLRSTAKTKREISNR